MKIKEIMAVAQELELKEPFAIANETVEKAENVFFKLTTDTGIEAWSAAAPDTVTSETNQTVTGAFKKVIRPLLLGRDPLRINALNQMIEENLGGNPSLKAGINMLLYDVLGRSCEMPLYRILGAYREKILTSVTVGINPVDVMVERSRNYLAQGFTCLKIKCGMDTDQDINVIRAIRAAAGPEIKLRLDANQGYSVEDALRVINTLEGLGADIEFMEQPTKADFLYALKEVTAKCPVPIMADETALTLRDSLKAIKMEIADMINIKLMKIGGISNAVKANVYAEQAEVPVMMGCMNESMAAMAGAVHFACAFGNVQYADLDAPLDFVDDPVKGGAEYEDGYVVPSEEPGLGIEVEL